MPRPASHDDRQFSDFCSVHAQEWNTAKVRFEVKTGKAPLAFLLRSAANGGSGRSWNRACYRHNMASAYCALWTVFAKVISGLRKPIAIQAAISFNINLPE
jgi:hypothetical protein